MDKFILLTNKDKLAYFEIAAEQLGLMPQVVEKDFWVCWILKVLFSLQGIGEHLTFKGGTSLSKCYKVIERFSEDIDISIERSILSSTHSIEPDKEISNKKNMGRLKDLKQSCQDKICKTILPGLDQAIRAIIPDNKDWKIEIDLDDPDDQTLLFTYPNSIQSSAESYLKSVVKIEFGARGDHWPSEVAQVIPYIADVPGARVITGTSVRVLAAERTFWEKATILHMIYHYAPGKKVPLRMSRHYYDIYSMVNSPIYKKAIKDISLLKNVAEHKSLFFKASWARYDEAQRGALRLVPGENQLEHLKSDYNQMQEMFFKKPPLFEHILKELRNIEYEINEISKNDPGL